MSITANDLARRAFHACLASPNHRHNQDEQDGAGEGPIYLVSALRGRSASENVSVGRQQLDGHLI